MATLLSAQQLVDKHTLIQLETMAKRMNVEVIGKQKKITIAEMIVAKQREIIAQSDAERQAIHTQIDAEAATVEAPKRKGAKGKAKAIKPEVATVVETVVEQPVEAIETTVEATVEEVTEHSTEVVTETIEAPVETVTEQVTEHSTKATESVFEVYTTADKSFDALDLTIRREPLEVKSSDGKAIYKVQIVDASQGDVIAQLGDYLFNQHNAFTYEQWLQITSSNEVIDGKIKLPALPKSITEEKIQSIVESAGDNAFGVAQKEKRIAEIQAQIANLQAELRELKKSSRSKSTGKVISIRTNVFKHGDSFQQTIELCQSVDSDGVEATMERFGKTKEYVTRAYRAYTRLYQGSEVIRDLYDSKRLSWAAIYKLAGSNPDKIGMASLEAKALHIAKPNTQAS